MAYERGFHSGRGGVAAGPAAGRGREGGERGDVAVDGMMEEVTPRVTHAGNGRE